MLDWLVFVIWVPPVFVVWLYFAIIEAVYRRRHGRPPADPFEYP